jgi:hypothetical protein
VSPFGKDADAGDVPQGGAVSRIHPDGDISRHGVPGGKVVGRGARVDPGIEADLEAVGLEGLDPFANPVLSNSWVVSPGMAEERCTTGWAPSDMTITYLG